MGGRGFQKGCIGDTARSNHRVYINPIPMAAAPEYSMPKASIGVLTRSSSVYGYGPSSSENTLNAFEAVSKTRFPESLNSFGKKLEIFVSPSVLKFLIKRELAAI